MGVLTLAGIILAPLTAVGGIVEGVLSTLPRFDYDQTISLDDSQPFGVKFIFRNTGSISAHNVAYGCHAPIQLQVDETQTEQILARHVEDDGGSAPNLVANKVTPTEPVFVECQNVLVAPLVNSDLHIVLRFRPSFVFWDTSQEFRFVFMRTAQGQARWIPEPLQANPFPSIFIPPKLN